MTNTGNPGSVVEMREAEAAARNVGLEVEWSKCGEPRNRAGFRGAPGPRGRTLYRSGSLVKANRIRINTLTLGARLPTMHGSREYVEAAGLMSYGPNEPDRFRRAADFVDKILRGAKPGDMPVEQPTKFDFVDQPDHRQGARPEVPPRRCLCAPTR